MTTTTRSPCQIDIDEGRREGLSSEEREELRRLRRENRILRGTRDLEKSRGLLRGAGRQDPAVIFGFVDAEKARHSISTLCRVLGVSRSGYHAWAKRTPCARALEDERLTERIREIHREHRGVYGSPRVHAELVLADGERLARKRVERLMRQAGISGLIRRRRGRTAIRVPGVRVCEDLVERQFAAQAPNRVWVADNSYLRTWQGWLYLIAAQDLYSRRIVGWSMADPTRAELVVDALQMALAQRRPEPGLIWHSDQGSQFVSLAFGQQARATGIAQSMGSKRDYDNSVAESFFATLKKELADRRSWPEKAELRSEIFDYIEVFYNRRRRHSTHGYRSPADYENSTLGPDAAGGAASRLITNEKVTTTAQAVTINAKSALSTETGELHLER